MLCSPCREVGFILLQCSQPWGHCQAAPLLPLHLLVLHCQGKPHVVAIRDLMTAQVAKLPKEGYIARSFDIINNYSHETAHLVVHCVKVMLLKLYNTHKRRVGADVVPEKVTAKTKRARMAEAPLSSASQGSDSLPGWRQLLVLCCRETSLSLEHAFTDERAFS